MRDFSDSSVYIKLLKDVKTVYVINLCMLCIYSDSLK